MRDFVGECGAARVDVSRGVETMLGVKDAAEQSCLRSAACLADTGFNRVLVAKVINLFLPKEKKLNPMIGACGISAFPMSARVVYKMAIKEDPQNYLLMQCVGVNVSGQVASVIAGGLLLNLLV